MTLSIAMDSAVVPSPANAETRSNRNRLAEAPLTAAHAVSRATATGAAEQQSSLTNRPADEQTKPDADSITRTVKQLRQQVHELKYTNLEFGIDEQYGEAVIKVTDAETKELIRQIPPEEVLELVAHLKELAEARGDNESLGALVTQGSPKIGLILEGQGMLLRDKA